MFYLQKTISVFVLFCFALFFVFLCGGTGWGGEGCGLELGVSVFEQLTLPSSNFMDKVRNDGKPSQSFTWAPFTACQFASCLPTAISRG